MKRLLSLTSLCACVSVAAPSHGDLMTWSDLPESKNAHSFAIDDGTVEVSSVGGDFARKQVGGEWGTGVAGGSVHGEIDGEEAITFQSETPFTVSSLSVSLLYTAGNYGDSQNESARLITDQGEFTLEASGTTAGTWDGPGELENIAPAIEGHGGAWTVSGEEIFGGPITSLTLTPANAGSHGQFGDFAFQSMNATAIPAPSAGLALLAIGAGLAPRRRRCGA